MPPPDAGTTPGVVDVKTFGVSVIVPDEVTGVEPTVTAAAYVPVDETPTDVTVPVAAEVQVGAEDDPPEVRT